MRLSMSLKHILIQVQYLLKTLFKWSFPFQSDFSLNLLISLNVSWKLWLYYCLNKTGTVAESIANTFTAICVLNMIDWHLTQDYNSCYILNVFRLLKVKGHWIQKLWNQQLILVFLINLLVNLKARPRLHQQVQNMSTSKAELARVTWDEQAGVLTGA